jgi:hypothetical protein
MKRRIVTERSFDWSATLEGHEHPVGRGATEREAIIDLESQLEGPTWYEELDHGSRP